MPSLSLMSHHQLSLVITYRFFTPDNAAVTWGYAHHHAVINVITLVIDTSTIRYHYHVISLAAISTWFDGSTYCLPYQYYWCQYVIIMPAINTGFHVINDYVTSLSIMPFDITWLDQFGLVITTPIGLIGLHHWMSNERSLYHQRNRGQRNGL